MARTKGNQSYNLYNILRAAGSEGVTKKQVAIALNVNESSISVYFSNFRKEFNAEIVPIWNGRDEVSYKLLNPESINVPNNASPVTKVQKPVQIKSKSKETFAILDEDIGGYTENEFQDLKSSLGL